MLVTMPAEPAAVEIMSVIPVRRKVVRAPMVIIVSAIPTTAKAGRRKSFIVIEFLLYWTDMRLKSFERRKI